MNCNIYYNNNLSPLVKTLPPLLLATLLRASGPEFETNVVGLAASQYLYLARQGSTRAYIEDRAVTFEVASGERWVTLSWAGAAPAGWSIAEPSGNVIHYCNQPNVELCRQAVPGYRRVTKTGLYSKIAWTLYGDGDNFEYDLIVHPGGKVENARFRVEGATARIENDGTLRAGEILQWRPTAYQWIDGKKVEVAAGFEKRADGAFGFSVGPHREDLELIIDPVIQTIAVLGGANDDAVVGTSTGSYCTAQYGVTQSSGWSQIPGSGQSVFVRFTSPTGNGGTQTVFWGGTGDSQIGGFSGSCSSFYLVGWTSAQDAPIMTGPSTSQIARAYAGGATDGFFLEFSNGTLVSASYLGGPGADRIYDIRLTLASGSLTAPFLLVGETDNSAWPNSTAQQIGPGGKTDAFAAMWSGQQLSMTVIGGTGNDRAMRLRPADGANWAIGGETDSPDFPSTSGSPAANGKDLWIGRISSDFSTAPTLRLFGGTGDEQFGGLAAIPGRGLYLAGTTTSTDLPGAGNTFGGGASDGFVAALDPLTAAPTASNYIGGSGRDEIHAMETDGYDLMLGGDTDSSDLVLPGLAAGQNVLGGLDALFVLSDAYGVPSRGIRFGGSADDVVFGVEVGTSNYGQIALGQVNLAGGSQSHDWMQSLDPFATGLGGQDGFAVAVNFADLRLSPYAQTLNSSPNVITGDVYIGRNLQMDVGIVAVSEPGMDGVVIVRSSDPSRLAVAANDTLPGTDQIAISSVDAPNGAAFTLQALSDNGVVDVIVEGRSGPEPNGIYPRHIVRVHLAPAALFLSSPQSVILATGKSANVNFYQAPVLPDGTPGPPQGLQPGLTEAPAATTSDAVGLPITSQSGGSVSFSASITAVNSGDYTLVPATSLFSAAPGQTVAVHAAPSVPVLPSVFGGRNYAVAQDNVGYLYLYGQAGDSLVFTSSDPSHLALGTNFDPSSATVTLPLSSSSALLLLGGLGQGTYTLSVTGTYMGQPVSETAQVAVVPYQVKFTSFPSTMGVGVAAYASATLTPQVPGSSSSWMVLPELQSNAILRQMLLQSSDSTVATVQTNFGQPSTAPTLSYTLTALRAGAVTLTFPASGPAAFASASFSVTVVPDTINLGVSTIRIPTGARLTLYPVSTYPSTPSSTLKAVRLRVVPPVCLIETINGSGTDVTSDFSSGYGASISAPNGTVGQQAVLYVSAPGVAEFPIPVHLVDPVFVPMESEVDLTESGATPYFQMEAYDMGQAYPIGLSAQLNQLPPLTPAITPARVCTVPNSVTSTGGGTFDFLLTCTGTGVATVSLLPGAGVSSAQPQFTVKVVSRPPAASALPLGTRVLTGLGLQTQFPVFSNSNAGYVPFVGTLTSNDPSRVLLSLDQNAAGSASVTVPADRSVGAVYVQGYGSDGVVTLSAQANDGTTGQVSVYLFPSTIAVRPVTQGITDPTPLTSLSQPLASPNFNAQALPYVVDPASQQLVSVSGISIRGGNDPVFIHAQSSDNTIVQPVPPDPIVSEADTSESMSFHASAVGNVTLSASQPAGFITVPDSALKTQVFEQTLSLSPAPVLSANLQTQASVVAASASGYSQVAGVTATSGDPTKLLLSTNVSTAGQASVTVPANGPLFLQAQSGVQPGDSVTVQLQGLGYSNSPATVNFVQAELVAGGSPPFVLQPLSNTGLVLNYGPLNANGAVANGVSLNPGVQQTLQVSTSDPTIVALPQTSIPFNTYMSIPLRALAPGQVQLQVQAPPGINNGVPPIGITVAPYQFPSIQPNNSARYLVSQFSVANPLAQPLPITVMAANGAPVLLGTAASGVGTPSLALLTPTLNANETRIFYLEPHGAGYSVTLQVLAANFTPATGSASVADPLVAFAPTSPLALSLQAGAAPLAVGLYGYPNKLLPLGASYGPLNIQLQSSNPAVVTVPASVSFAPGDSSKSVQITPVAAGQAVVSLIVPASFAGGAATRQDLVVTVQ
jgi:hypothetical protein